MISIRRCMVGAITALGMAVFLLPAASASANDPGDTGTFALLSGWNSKCIAIGSASHANGEPAIQWDCNGKSEQKWTMTLLPGASATYTIKNSESGKCLAIGSASTSAGAEAIQWTCNGGDEQTWIWDSAYRLRNVNSQLCLAIPNKSITNGVALIQWTCTLNSEQYWT